MNRTGNPKYLQLYGFIAMTQVVIAMEVFGAIYR